MRNCPPSAARRLRQVQRADVLVSDGRFQRRPRYARFPAIRSTPQLAHRVGRPGRHPGESVDHQRRSVSIIATTSFRVGPSSISAGAALPVATDRTGPGAGCIVNSGFLSRVRCALCLLLPLLKLRSGRGKRMACGVRTSSASQPGPTGSSRRRSAAIALHGGDDWVTVIKAPVISMVMALHGCALAAQPGPDYS